MKPTATFPWVGILTLAALIFTSVTIEFLPTGLLPEIAADLDVSLSQVGLLVSIFAGTVVLSAAPLATLTRPFPRKTLVLIVLLVFVASSVLTGLAPSYPVMVGARVLGGLAHGLFWAVVGAYSGHLVPKKMLGRAVAITSAGGTAAFVLGVPLGTAIGHAFGWRVAFLIMAGIILVLAAVAARLLPPVQHLEPLVTGEIPLPLRKDKSIPGIILVCAVVIVVMTAHNLFYTYIAPFLLGPVGVATGSVAFVLFLYGSAAVIGLVFAGVLADRFPRAGLAGAILVIVSALVVIGLVPGTFWIVFPALVVWSIGFGAAPPMLQARLLHTASKRMRDIASAYLTTSFNLGIGLGAFIGAVLLDAVGVGVLPLVAAGLTLVGVVVLLVGDARLHRRAAVAPPRA
jgi:predicted MFS family arabinose efflux permease